MALRLERKLSGSASAWSYLVTPQQLAAALGLGSGTTAAKAVTAVTAAAGPSRIVPLCAAYFLPNDAQRRQGVQVFRRRRIPGARFLDIDAVKDEASPYPHMVPSAAGFAQAMGGLGIGRSDTVVVYDTEELGLLSAPRVAWMLRLFGHPRVHVLDNFLTWTRQGYPTESGDPPPPPAAVEYGSAALVPGMLATFDEMQQVARDALARRHSPDGPGKPAVPVQVLDARSTARWAGHEAEPRPGIASGHIPGSRSFPFQQLLDPATKSYLPPDQLRAVFASQGVDPAQPLIATCGSGVTAAVIETALLVAGYATTAKSIKLYDGSWAEWGRRCTEESGLIEKADLADLDETAGSGAPQ